MDRVHKIVIKSWGREVWFENNELYCGKELLVYQGKWSSEGLYHYHVKKDETFYSINGVLKLMYIDENNVEREIILRQGDSFRIKPGIRHKFTSLSEFCIFIEVSTTHSDNDSYRVCLT